MNTTVTCSQNISCTGNCSVPDSAHPAVAQLTGSCRSERTRHLSQGCLIAGSRDGGFSGYALERRHRPEKRHQVLHSFW